MWIGHRKEIRKLTRDSNLFTSLPENETCTNKSIVVKAKEKVNVELRLKMNLFREKNCLT